MIRNLTRNDARALAYIQRFALRYDRRRPRILTQRLIDQLDACKCDAARRLILGIGEKEEACLPGGFR